MTGNKYLQILELQPGVSRKEIKAAYRRLSKKYHPDVSKDADAKEKFISINEAYKFLMEVGAHPRQQAASATAYDYDPYEQAYRAWRQKAKEYARKKAFEAERERSLLIKEILDYFNYFSLLIGLFNTLLVVDYLLPRQIQADEIVAMENTYKVYDRRYGNKNVTYKYIDVELKTNHVRLEPETTINLNIADQVMITSTTIFNKPVSLQITGGNTSQTFRQAYGIYRGFGFLIPVALASFIFYSFVVKNQENKFSLAIVLCILFIIQLYIFISV